MLSVFENGCAYLIQHTWQPSTQKLYTAAAHDHTLRHVLQLSLGPRQVCTPTLRRGRLLAQQLRQAALSSRQFPLKALQSLHKIACLPHVLGLAHMQACFCDDISGPWVKAHMCRMCAKILSAATWTNCSLLHHVEGSQ